MQNDEQDKKSAGKFLEMTARDAWVFLEKTPGARLVDVRTPQEWETIGVPDLDSLGKTPLFVSWPKGGTPAQIDAFAQTLIEVAPDKSAPLVFLCRSGMRSLAAGLLMQSLGYETVVNVSDGFEGNPSAGAGWRATLPSAAKTL